MRNTKYKAIVSITLVGFLLFLALVYVKQRLAPRWAESARPLYDNIPSRLYFLPPSSKETQKLIDGAWKEFERIGKVANAFSPQSELGILNAQKDKTKMLVSPDLASLISDSLLVYEKSGKAFDPTIFPLKTLWREAQKRNSPPKDAEIKEILERVGMDKVFLNPKTHTLHFQRADVQFDFGGIAKGYAVDRVHKYLAQNGVKEGLVQCGGEIAAWDDAQRREWKIAIQHPKEMNTLWGTITSRGNLRVSTSGNYRQPIMIQNREYYHVFDPRTGYPVSSRILSVTLASFSDSPSNTIIDALTKSILVLGEEKGLEIIKGFHLEAIIIVERDGKIIEIMTEGMKSHYARSGTLN